MMKVQADDNEVVTKGFLRTTLRETINEAIDGLAATINKSFVGLETRLESRMEGMAQQKDLLALTERVKSIEWQLNGHDREFRGLHDNFALVFQELKSIRERLDRIEKNDVTADVINLDLRVKKLEKKAGLQ